MEIWSDSLVWSRGQDTQQKIIFRQFEMTGNAGFEGAVRLRLQDAENRQPRLYLTERGYVEPFVGSKGLVCDDVDRKELLPFVQGTLCDVLRQQGQKAAEFEIYANL